ncbi:coiled-coil and C2 domain-containing protein 1-like isoform X3 [Colias croceus]|uniref:coiled-coil and C2 domain-containing protein 1-like isoform X2 n=1 Tax=Colias crocea TaxID=72248 RepID=UPI001E27DA81|nr:coiled-coil and C2 domain-containing protein 1-like isoform X2 [Colias croceus]XP_045511698.1 coiled-coil and C2 domain-containing protein 1-like isoform X3 [Colias croceus]
MSRKPNSGKRGNLSQFGLIDMPDLDDEPMDLSDDDGDLEAELAAITGGGGKRSKPKKPAAVAPADLDAMIAASLRDVPSDDEGSGDDDDPDLLNELQELALDDEAPRLSRPAPPPPGAVSAENSTVSLLQERISNYTIAEKAAKDSGESSRARRFGRGLKTLNDLLKQAKAGRPINDEDIPPAVSVGKPAAPVAPSAPPDVVPSTPEPVPQPPARRAPAPPPRAESLEKRPATPPEPKEPPPQLPTEPVDPAKEEGLRFILKRKEEFKAAALASKHAGDKTMALEYLKVVKQFDIVVQAFQSGEAMDLNELPTPEAIAAAVRAQTSEEQVQNSAEPTPAPVSEGTLITASTVDEALRQRLAAFQEQEAKAKEQGNSSKARRMGRIVKQYQDAIKLHAAGKPLPLDELPTPNGFAPIPGEQQSPKPAPSPASPRSPAGPASPSVPAPSPRPSPQLSRNDKQLLLLMHRQKEYKEAAINAKKSGNIEQAKEYLRAAKGFDSLIEATKGGLPVDLKSIPLPPKAKKQIEETFDIVAAEDCDPREDSLITSDGDDVMSRLHAQLTRQLKLCVTNRDHYRAMGNIAESNRFEHMAVSVKQDLDVVAVAKNLNQPPPTFHYEGRQFAIVQCNSDLNENDLELTIVRGIAYNVPNPREVDTYVKFEFPFPQDAPASERTALVKDTNSPQYDATFVLPIQRQARACLRVFKRHGVKFEVYSRGCNLLCCSGWFSKDTMLGAVSVKLAPLETQVTLHEAYPLMDGRRPAGGSLEVRMRVRTPLLQQQIEHTKHRWLVIDN